MGSSFVNRVDRLIQSNAFDRSIPRISKAMILAMILSLFGLFSAIRIPSVIASRWVFVSNILLNWFAYIVYNWSPPYFMNSALMLSIPEAFPLLRRLIACCTSSIVIGFVNLWGGKLLNGWIGGVALLLLSFWLKNCW
jgi:hypothetical protein